MVGTKIGIKTLVLVAVDAEARLGAGLVGRKLLLVVAGIVGLVFVVVRVDDKILQRPFRVAVLGPLLDCRITAGLTVVVGVVVDELGGLWLEALNTFALTPWDDASGHNTASLCGLLVTRQKRPLFIIQLTCGAALHGLVYVRRIAASIYRVSASEHLNAQPCLQEGLPKGWKEVLRTVHEVLERPPIVHMKEKDQDAERGPVYRQLRGSILDASQPQLLVLVKH